ncbi:hypothetical protein EYC80_006636 [Monilinia laxa]|uniref:Response regulatory domain-containing protein n=1 Tax=Monilinia laxa TaxID=61186 RepID=A0A5N6JV57_MONLA|nr:hypothetical protein EYC80_006636 [Monilinia laxa]
MFTPTITEGNVKNALVTADQIKYVMNDLPVIKKYKSRPCIAGWPDMRFYAEVPIYSPEKHVIETYCVVDNKPRYEGLSDEGFTILNEIATAIMSHLQLIEKQNHLVRGEKMAKGLGLFEGEGCILLNTTEFSISYFARGTFLSNFVIISTGPYELASVLGQCIGYLHYPCSQYEKLEEQHDTASNGLEAFEKYKKTPGSFEMIIMDISMPVMDGLNASRHIREYESTNGLSRCGIVALTCLFSNGGIYEGF